MIRRRPLRAVSPLLTVLGGIVEAVKAIGALGGTLRALAGLAGIEGVAGVAGAGALLPVTIAAVGVGALAVTVMNFGAMLDGLRDLWGIATGGSGRSDSYRQTVLNKARAAVGDDPEAQRRWVLSQNRGRDYDAVFGHHGRDADGISTPDAARAAAQERQRRALGLDGAVTADKLRAAIAADKGLLGSATGDRAAKIQAEMDLLQQRLDAATRSPDASGMVHRTAYRSGEGDDWRNLMVPASYNPSDSGDVVRGAMLDTASGVHGIRDAVDRLAARLAVTGYTANGDGTISAADSGSGGRSSIRFGRPGTATGGDMPNMRYGRGGGGSYRSTPGSGNAAEIGPKVSLGKMGAKFAAKAPVIMDGLMKKYGLTREQAAGVLGNLGHESAGFTAYHEGGQEAAKGGVGWAQWTGPRRRQFEAWTKAHGLNPTSDEASWRYLTEGDPETAKAILAVKRTTNRRDAVRAFHDSFERSADISHGVIVKQKSWNSRLNYADKAFAAQPGGASVAGGSKPLGTPENPVTVKADPKSSTKGAPLDPATIAGRVHPSARPRPGTGDAPGANVSADNSSVNYNTFHIAHPDPHHVARTVAAHLDRSGGMTIDRDVFA